MIADIPFDALLPRRDLARELGKRGYIIAWSTLASMATRGGGPPYHHFGPRVLYRWGDAVAWAKARLGPAVTSTAELDALRAAAEPAEGEASSENPWDRFMRS